MMSDIELEGSLKEESDFHTPLERVNFEAGMLLGVEATQSEQAYHRLRLNRHRYWYHGSGTLVGFGVSMKAGETRSMQDDFPIDLIVSPGVGIDGLGRDVMSFEPYCINLKDWFASQLQSSEGNLLLQNGLEEDGQNIRLLVTMRYHGCATGFQPVMARKINAGTDPVQPSRTRDSLLLEIISGSVPEKKNDWPWKGHRPKGENLEEDLTNSEKQYISGFSGSEKKLLELQSQLVYSLPNHDGALEVSQDFVVDLSRTVLAQLQVPLRTNKLPELSPIINPNRIKINNLVRPFINTVDQLAWLTQEEVKPKPRVVRPSGPFVPNLPANKPKPPIVKPKPKE